LRVVGDCADEEDKGEEVVKDSVALPSGEGHW
jgi:hypothetical protein